MFFDSEFMVLILMNLWALVGLYVIHWYSFPFFTFSFFVPFPFFPTFFLILSFSFYDETSCQGVMTLLFKGWVVPRGVPGSVRMGVDWQIKLIRWKHVHEIPRSVWLPSKWESTKPCTTRKTEFTTKRGTDGPLDKSLKTG